MMLTFQHALQSFIQRISVYISQIAEFMSILNTYQLMFVRANLVFTARVKRNVYCKYTTWHNTELPIVTVGDMLSLWRSSNR